MYIHEISACEITSTTPKPHSEVTQIDKYLLLHPIIRLVHHLWRSEPTFSVANADSLSRMGIPNPRSQVKVANVGHSSFVLLMETPSSRSRLLVASLVPALTVWIVAQGLIGV
jgi:hypothetical protein